MITNVIANDFPYPAKTGGVWKLAVSVAKLPTSIQDVSNDFCYCGFDCNYEELALADVADASSYKNDSSSFLFRKVNSADTISFTLRKNGVQVAVLNDNTFGTLYTSFAQQPLYSGFAINWRAVLATFGAGKYNFIATLNILGTIYTSESRQFRLLPFSDEVADSTVRIESFQNGNIIDSEFDFAGLNWYSSYRIGGFFGEKTPVLEVDNYVNQEYKKVQIADRLRVEYTLYTRLLPSEISNAIAYNQMLANRILVTDYNVLNHEIYRQIEVRPISFSETTFIQQNRNVRFAIKLEPISDGLRKRNF